MIINNKTTTRVIILGADGMLGNAIFRYLKMNNINVIGTSRKKDSNYYFFDAESFDLKTFNSMNKKLSPQYIINCIGYIRPLDESFIEIKKSLIINSVFPQNLSQACIKSGIRFIHFSTDCVFSGKNGPYAETDQSDEVGIYGVSKFLGEVRQLPSLTIRTSIIGRELNNNRNLLDWFLSTTSHSVNGFAQVYWNGVSTITIAKIIKLIIEENINFNKPLIQIASDTVTKYDLLCFFKDIFNKDIDIIKYLDTASNKTLIPSIEQEKFFKNLIPPIKNQIEELKKFYE